MKRFITFNILLSSMEELMVVTGPSCVGKTLFVNTLLHNLPLEKISMDSYQVYQKFSIGTGRSDSLIPTHLQNFLNPKDYLPPDVYVRLALDTVNRIEADDKHAIFEGCSTSYLSALFTCGRQLEVVGIKPPSLEWMKEQFVRRVQSMIDTGLILEVERGLALGYRKTRVLSETAVYLPVVEHVDGKITLTEAIERSPTLKGGDS